MGLRRTLPRAALALTALAANACAGDNVVRRWLVGVFGPTEVEMVEAYEGEGGGAVFDHGDFDRLLQTYVDADGFVDYRGLAADRAGLDRYVAALTEAPFGKLSRDGKLALLINAYNAFTLTLILERGGADLESIRDIPSSERWEKTRWRLAGETISLDTLEHERIRPRFREPRVHWALVCAAVSCPPLRAEAYEPSKLEAQLADQADYVHRRDTLGRYVQGDASQGALTVTELYSWYRGDFEQVHGSVPGALARYLSSVDPKTPPELSFISYDWRLNDRARR